MLLLLPLPVSTSLLTARKKLSFQQQ